MLQLLLRYPERYPKNALPITLSYLMHNLLYFLADLIKKNTMRPLPG